MGTTNGSPRTEDPLARRLTHEEIDALRDENAQLRELVIQLSKLVIKNVVDHKQAHAGGDKA